MRRPDGFDAPRKQPGDAQASGVTPDTAADAADDEAGEVVSISELRRRRIALEREAALLGPASPQAGAGDSPEGTGGRRWALGAYADLVDEPVASAPEASATNDRTVEASADSERGSFAQRVDRAWRTAQKEQRKLDRAELHETKREARLAAKARKRAERAEVRRFTADRRKQLRYALLGIAGLAAAFGLLLALVWTPVMAVREIRVEGTSSIDPATVEAVLADQLGEPIATVTEQGVAERLQAIPQIESFALDLVPPSAIVVRLVERTPVAVLSSDAGSSVIDPAGVVLGPVGETPQALPVLDGIALGTEQFSAVAEMLVSLPPDVLAAIESITAPTPSDIQLQLNTGQTVQWGGAEESALKADVVAALMATQDPSAAGVLDVRAPEQPVIRGS